MSKPPPTQLKTIAFVSNSGDLGGAECVLLDLLDIIVGHYHPVVMVPTHGPLAKKLSERGISYTVTHHTPWTYHTSLQWPPLWLNSQIWYALKLAHFIRKERASLVYSNTMVTGSGLFAAFLLRKPHICHIHESSLDYLPYRFLLSERLTLYLINRLSQKIILVSHFLNTRFKAHFASQKVEVVYNLVQISPVEGSRKSFEAPLARPQTTRLCMVGFMFPLKRQEHGILAVGHLKKTGHSVTLDLIGSGVPEYIDYLNELIAINGVAHEVRLRGHFENAAPIMDQNDIVLICSEIESFSRVTVEAMRLGKLVIVSDRGALPEIVTHMKTGLIYPYGDIPQLATWITWAINNPEHCKTIQHAAKEWVAQTLTFERNQNQILAILNSVIGE